MAACRGHQVFPDPEGDTTATDRDGRSQSAKWARAEGDDDGYADGKQRRVEKRRERGAAGAPRPTSHSAEPSETDWCPESRLLQHSAWHVARRKPGSVWGWPAGEVAGLVPYVKWAGRTRDRRERHGTHLFRDALHRAERLQDRGSEMPEDRWRKMLGVTLPD